MRAVVEVFRRLGQTLGPLSVPVRAVLVGGAAVHVYTRSRVSADVDAIFSHRILVPGDLLAEWDDEGQRRALTFDPNFFHALALMHPDAEAEALPLGVEPWPNLSLWALTPVDLAVSKLARWQSRDADDVEALGRAGLITGAVLRARATEALDWYVGDPRWLKLHLDEACGLVEIASADGGAR